MRRSRQRYLLTLPRVKAAANKISTQHENKQLKILVEGKHNLVMETSASTPKSIRLIEGGIRIPKVPSCNGAQIEFSGSYPNSRMLGTATVPIVAAVVTEEPEVAENKLQAAIFV